MNNLLQAVERSNQKSVGPALQVYGLATPLTFDKLYGMERVTSFIYLSSRHAHSHYPGSG